METIFRWVTKGGRRWLAPIRVGGRSTIKDVKRKQSSGPDEPIELVGEKRELPPPFIELQEFNERDQPIELVGEKRELQSNDKNLS